MIFHCLILLSLEVRPTQEKKSLELKSYTGWVIYFKYIWSIFQTSKISFPFGRSCEIRNTLKTIVTRYMCHADSICFICCVRFEKWHVLSFSTSIIVCGLHGDEHLKVVYADKYLLISEFFLQIFSKYLGDP